MALRSLELLDTGRDAAFDLFPHLACRLFETPIAAVSLVDEDRQWFKAREGLEETQQTPREIAFCAHTILEESGVLVIPDATKDERFRNNPLVTGEFGLRFYAGAVITDDSGLPLGSLCIIDRQPRELTAERVEELRRLALGVTTALRMQRSMVALREMALRDALTGAANRNGFDQALQAILASPTPRGALLWLDLDRFKAINDGFGHKAGDAALRAVVDRLRATLRPDDMVARLGGDEFAVLCPGLAGEQAALALAHRIHAALADPFHVDGSAIPLRTSIGIAVIPRDGRTPEAVMSAADAALYVAKGAGRGTTRLATPAPAAA
jgi:diguanylate cyclase (GGDEF)-like protein